MATLDIESTDQRLSPYRFIIGGLTMLLNLSAGLSFFAVSPVTPVIMDDYGINRGTVSLLTSLVILVQSGFAIPAGMLVGRVGLKKLIAFAWLLLAVPSLSFLGSSFPMLLALRVLYGLGFAVSIPALGPLLMQWFRPKELPLINGINLGVATLGITISTFLAAPLAQAIGWREMLSVCGGISMAGAVCWAILGRSHEPARVVGHFSVRQVWNLLRARTTLLMAMADAGPFALYVGLTAWLPTFYFEAHGMSLTRAGALAGLLPFAGMFAVVLVGILALRFPRRRPFILIPGVMLGLGGFGSFLLGGSILVYPALLLAGIGAWAYLPALFTIPMELPDSSPESVALVWATIMTLGGLLGFLSPLVIGVLTDVLGTYLVGFMLFAALSWSLVVAGLLLPETGVPSTQ